MMLSKTPTGVGFFDDSCGGAFRGRPMLVSGPTKSGKSVIAMQFITAGLKHQERCLYLSAQPARDVAVCADSMGVPFLPAVEAGRLILLEYNNFIPGRDMEHNLMLPPGGFQQLQEIIEVQAITRLAIDTILPWVVLPSPDHLAEHIYSFVRAFERMGVTALFTMPRPASPAAVRLHRTMEDVLPISVLLLREPSSRKRTWLTNKYLGGTPKQVEFSFEIRRGKLAVLFEPPPPTPPRPAAPPPAAPGPERKAPSEDKASGVRASLADSLFEFSA